VYYGLWTAYCVLCTECYGLCVAILLLTRVVFLQPFPTPMCACLWAHASNPVCGLWFARAHTELLLLLTDRARTGNLMIVSEFMAMGEFK
jgi:hypothetical protein